MDVDVRIGLLECQQFGVHGLGRDAVMPADFPVEHQGSTACTCFDDVEKFLFSHKFFFSVIAYGAKM